MKTYLRKSAPSEGSDQPAHSCNLIRLFPGCVLDSQEWKVSSCGQWRLWSDCADAQADLSLRLANISDSTFPRNAALKHKTKTAIEVIIPLAPVFDSLVLTTCPSAFRRRRRTHMQYTATPMITQTISAPITIPAVRPWAPLPRLPPRLLVLKTQHKGKYRQWQFLFFCDYSR